MADLREARRGAAGIGINPTSVAIIPHSYNNNNYYTNNRFKTVTRLRARARPNGNLGLVQRSGWKGHAFHYFFDVACETGPVPSSALANRSLQSRTLPLFSLLP